MPRLKLQIIGMQIERGCAVTAVYPVSFLLLLLCLLFISTSVMLAYAHVVLISDGLRFWVLGCLMLCYIAAPSPSLDVQEQEEHQHQRTQIYPR